MSKSVIEDYLDEDDPISGQKYALVSFISPENVLEKKDLFFFERFLQSYEVDWKVKGLEEFLANRVSFVNRELNERANALDKEGKTEVADVCRQSRIKVDTILEEYHTFIRTKQKELTKTKIGDAWDDFLFKEQAKLEEEFHAKNNFRTSIRGFKVRAVARDEKEAEVRAKKLQNSDKYHNIYCAEVGKWTPWDPKPHMIAEQEYAQEELNTLMKKYKENEDSKTTFFNEQRREGIKESKEAAKEGGGAKKLFGIVNETAQEEAAAQLEAKAAAIEAIEIGPVSVDKDTQNTLFNGPADLAMERKLRTATAVAVTEATATTSATTEATATTPE
jgi:hypothetical protein